MAGTIQSGGRSRGAIVGINVTPMVDVVLVLLVIMMVSATYIVAQSIRVELPRAATGEPGSSSTATVTLTRARALYFNEAPVTEEVLRARITDAVGRNAELSVVITADREASHGAVMHVVDLARTAGVVHFAVNVENGP